MPIYTNLQDAQNHAQLWNQLEGFTKTPVFMGELYLQYVAMAVKSTVNDEKSQPVTVTQYQIQIGALETRPTAEFDFAHLPYTINLVSPREEGLHSPLSYMVAYSTTLPSNIGTTLERHINKLVNGITSKNMDNFIDSIARTVAEHIVQIDRCDTTDESLKAMKKTGLNDVEIAELKKNKATKQREVMTKIKNIFHNLTLMFSSAHRAAIMVKLMDAISNKIDEPENFALIEETLLGNAIEMHDAITTKFFIIARNVDPYKVIETQNKSGFSLAIDKEDILVLNAILQNYRLQNDQTTVKIMLYAVKAEKMEMAKAIFDALANKFDKPMLQGNTSAPALLAAVLAAGDFAWAQKIWQHGADINQVANINLPEKTTKEWMTEVTDDDFSEQLGELRDRLYTAAADAKTTGASGTTIKYWGKVPLLTEERVANGANVNTSNTSFLGKLFSFSSK